MARIRTVKPELFKHEELFDLEMETGLPIRIAFIGLFGCCDREGRFKWRPRALKPEILPYDDGIDFEDVLTALAGCGMVLKYRVGNEVFGCIPTFLKHQTINQREAQSVIPSPDEGTIDDCMQGTCMHVHAHGEGKGREGKEIEAYASVNSEADAHELDLVDDDTADRKVTPKSGESIVGLACPVGTLVNLYHEHMPENPRVRVLDDPRKKAIRARWRQAAGLTCKPFGYATQEAGIVAWTSFFRVCAQSDFLTGKAKPSPGKPPFFADIDFLMSPSGFKRCLENKYHRDTA